MQLSVTALNFLIWLLPVTHLSNAEVDCQTLQPICKHAGNELATFKLLLTGLELIRYSSVGLSDIYDKILTLCLVCWDGRITLLFLPDNNSKMAFSNLFIKLCGVDKDVKDSCESESSYG